MIGIAYKKLLKKFPKTIVIFFVIFIIFPVFSNKVNPQMHVQNLVKPFSVPLNSSAFPGNLFAQTSDQEDPFYLELLREGKYFYDNGNYAEAIENFKIVFIGFLDNMPKLFECYAYLTVCYYQIRNLEQAKYFYNEIKRLKLQEYFRVIEFPPSLLDKYIEISAYFSRLEAKALTRPSSFRTALDTEIKRLKEAIKKNRRNSEAYFTLLTIYLKQNNIKNAKSIINDLLKEYPRNGNAYFELGKIYASEKKYEEALQQFQKASSFLQNDVDIQYEIAKVYYELKNYYKSKQEFLKVKEFHKNYKDTEIYLASIEALEKRKD